MICVFGAFTLGDNRIIKLFGLGLASAVLIDALIVRTLMVPALMLLLGRLNWAMPATLDRILPQIDVEGAATEQTVEPLVPGGAASEAAPLHRRFGRRYNHRGSLHMGVPARISKLQASDSMAACTH